MFKPEAIYKMKDVMNLVINKTDDNRMHEKRLLKGTVEVGSMYLITHKKSAAWSSWSSRAKSRILSTNLWLLVTDRRTRLTPAPVDYCVHRFVHWLSLVVPNKHSPASWSLQWSLSNPFSPFSPSYTLLVPRMGRTTTPGWATDGNQSQNTYFLSPL